MKGEPMKTPEPQHKPAVNLLMTQIPTTVTIMDVFKLTTTVSCKGPHTKHGDWPPKFTDHAVVGYFDVPLDGRKPLRVGFEIPLCDVCRKLVVD
jgi:hypothetical protein